MKDIIWLSPSLAAGAIAARLVAFFERRPQMSSRRGVELTAPSRPAEFQTGHERTMRLGIGPHPRLATIRLSRGAALPAGTLATPPAASGRRQGSCGHRR